MRADAEDNRRALLEAAREIYVEEGTSVALDKIAKRAGVGIGTLYRRFPDRDALLRGVLVDLFESMSAAVRRAEAEARDAPDGPPAWEAVVRAVAGLGLGPTLPVIFRERFDLIDEPAVAAAMRGAITGVEGVYRRAQEAGLLRADVSFLEVQMLAGMLSQSGPSRPPMIDPETLTDRLVGILLDGLRAGPAHRALPGEPTVFSPLDPDDRAAVERAIAEENERRARG
ncbi:transcriptional regulator, TetR family [Catenulispora acidiphila DSM 44928]|uniref:Transcriptional regulator, TetR family n=1 Tax=Catenulispora acidiphila (strain DSM 44928 / JCM 14897 / NBRC 102108 / NRRL B-24433 / ID139908) TaxID=479433 RepID=C7Q0S4_CATAD|nr:TetR/AcrR family transcriptional regulator [Catenulispora acidiphila]ACU69702.1 transcriptional regulator, TetR family [Catenulispora acidiphila DSM 44928]